MSEKLAVDDDLIRKNPFEFQLATIVVNGSVTREAITRKQKRAFLNTPDYCFPYCFWGQSCAILCRDMPGKRVAENAA